MQAYDMDARQIQKNVKATLTLYCSDHASGRHFLVRTRRRDKSITALLSRDEESVLLNSLSVLVVKRLHSRMVEERCTFVGTGLRWKVELALSIMWLLRKIYSRYYGARVCSLPRSLYIEMGNGKPFSLFLWVEF